MLKLIRFWTPRLCIVGSLVFLPFAAAAVCGIGLAAAEVLGMFGLLAGVSAVVALPVEA